MRTVLTKEQQVRWAKANKQEAPVVTRRQTNKNKRISNAIK